MIFYPALTRRDTYRSPYGKGGEFADYHAYYDEVAEDCKQRCVYCDALVSENLGGDKMHLDHFRPQKHYDELKTNPNNLVLACPACNLFKSDHWPAKGTDETYTENAGFIDPFEDKQKDFFTISSEGAIASKKGPAEYIINLLNLDRPARRELRRRRIIQNKVNQLLGTLIEKQQAMASKARSGEIGMDEYWTYNDVHVGHLKDLKAILQELV